MALMSYEQKKIEEVKKSFNTAVVVFIATTVCIGAYFVYQKSKSPEISSYDSRKNDEPKNTVNHNKQEGK